MGETARLQVVQLVVPGHGGFGGEGGGEWDATFQSRSENKSEN